MQYKQYRHDAKSSETTSTSEGGSTTESYLLCAPPRPSRTVVSPGSRKRPRVACSGTTPPPLTKRAKTQVPGNEANEVRGHFVAARGFVVKAISSGRSLQPAGGPLPHGGAESRCCCPSTIRFPSWLAGRTRRPPVTRKGWLGH